jgi:hypothetical protein
MSDALYFLLSIMSQGWIERFFVVEVSPKPRGITVMNKYMSPEALAMLDDKSIVSFFVQGIP